MSVLGKNWKYINEGNVHVVLCVLNTDYVIRLIKEDGSSTKMETIHNSVDFVNYVMIPLLFGKTLYKEEIIRLSTEDIANLSENLMNIRPKHRQVKSIFSQFAIKAPNLTMISHISDNYCLEIKPKEGFMSSCFSRYSKCYYCLKQFLKLQEKQVDNISGYCPLDLFSGEKMRMRKAILNLIHNPQNNLKLFKDGNIIYNENSNVTDFETIIRKMNIFYSLSTFLDFIIEILLSDGISDINLNESDYDIDMIAEKCNKIKDLSVNCFLSRLLTLQKLSDTLNLDSIDTSEDFQYVAELLKNMRELNVDLEKSSQRKNFLATTDPKYIAMISAVAKDCSIMICFSPEKHESYPSVKIGNKSLSYKISVTDLEPKPIKSLTKRKKTEQKLIELYEKLNEKTNLIQPHSETRAKQLEAWQQLISEYLKATKQSTIDIRESQNSPLFNNASINRKLSSEALLTILEDMAKTGRAASVDKSKNIWEVYWHSLDEWGNMIYSWASSNGLNNSVCTLFELQEGDNTVGEEFHGIDMNILVKALKTLEVKGKCELMEFDDSQGVKFF